MNYRFYTLVTYFILGFICRSFGQYSSPIDSHILLSGSFAEPRTNHFHAGIDFKAQKGFLKDTIYAVSDGYISRINILAEGYGNALYINHGETTSVYAHLHHFMPWIQEYMDSVMYARKLNEHIEEPTPNKLLVQRGDAIGILGNTGRSSGPHLHFEIRRTSDQVALNPFNFGIKPTDHAAPVIRGVIIYEMSPDGQELRKNYYPATKKSDGSYQLENDLLVANSLVVGLGIHCYDMMDGASNHNGIYGLQMWEGGIPKFGFTFNEVDFRTSQYIHAHMDYEAKMDKKYFTKCFKNVANELSFYKTDQHDGLIDIYDFYAKDIKIEVRDFDGNISSIQLKLKRSSDVVMPASTIIDHRIIPMDSAQIICGKNRLTIAPHTFCQPVDINCKEIENGIDLSQNNVPTFRNVRIDLHFDSTSTDRAKYCIVSQEDDKISRHLATWSNDKTLTAFVRDLKAYSIGIDTISPKIEIINIANKTRSIKLKLTDNFEPAHPKDKIEYEMLIDDHWVLCKADAKTDVIWHELTIPRKNTSHSLEFKATDAAGNVSSIRRNFQF